MATKKKVGSIDGYFKNVKTIGSYVKKEFEYNPYPYNYETKMFERKDLYEFDEYGKEIHLHLNGKNGKKPDLNRDNIYELTQKNFDLLKKMKRMFIKEETASSYWVHNETSRKAMQKFATITMLSDFQKLVYSHKIVSKGNKETMPIKDVYTTVLPIKREATPKDDRKLKYHISELIKRLDKTEGGFHVNSSEYKKMKSAIIKLHETLDKEGHTNADVGQKLEVLQDATMKYMQAKGVGNQSSTRGQLRMDASLDIFEVSNDFMDVYASNERIAEVQKLEKEYGVSLTSEKGVFRYHKDVVVDHYKDAPEPQKEKAAENGGPML